MPRVFLIAAFFYQPCARHTELITSAVFKEQALKGSQDIAGLYYFRKTDGKITKEDVIESEVLLDLDPEQLSHTRARIFPLGGHFRGKINYIPGTDVMYGLFQFQLQFPR